jgi:hypothetical protein
MSLRHGRHAPVVTADASGGAGLAPVPLRLFRKVASRRSLMALGLTCLVIGTAVGGAFAYWNGHGPGSSSGATGTMATPSVVAFTGGDAPSNSLLPGSSSDVILRISNTNSYAVMLTAISINGSITGSGGIGTCTTTGVTTNFPTSPAIAVPAGSTLIHLSGAALMSTSSQSGCQGATFSIPVSLTFKK